MVYWVAEFISGDDLILQLIFLVNFLTKSVDFTIRKIDQFLVEYSVRNLVDFQLILQLIFQPIN